MQNLRFTAPACLSEVKNSELIDPEVRASAIGVCLLQLSRSEFGKDLEPYEDTLDQWAMALREAQRNNIKPLPLPVPHDALELHPFAMYYVALGAPYVDLSNAMPVEDVTTLTNAPLAVRLGTIDSFITRAEKTLTITREIAESSFANDTGSGMSSCDVQCAEAILTMAREIRWACLKESTALHLVVSGKYTRVPCIVQLLPSLETLSLDISHGPSGLKEFTGLPSLREIHIRIDLQQTPDYAPSCWLKDLPKLDRIVMYAKELIRDPGDPLARIVKPRAALSCYLGKQIIQSGALKTREGGHRPAISRRETAEFPF